uniref:Uncharacterized protein n=1 Tax=Ditylenchus dipsaci TaxID=166011 RepID=A0A915DQH3_9BILA
MSLSARLFRSLRRYFDTSPAEYEEKLAEDRLKIAQISVSIIIIIKECNEEQAVETVCFADISYSNSDFSSVASLFTTRNRSSFPLYFPPKLSYDSHVDVQFSVQHSLNVGNPHVGNSINRSRLDRSWPVKSWSRFLTLCVGAKMSFPSKAME